MAKEGTPVSSRLKTLLALMGLLGAGIGLVLSCALWAAALVLTLERESGAVGLSILGLIVFGLTVGSAA